MAKTITIMTGSVRPNSVGAQLLPLVRAELEKRDDVTVQIADVKQLGLPFLDSPVSPADESYVPQHQSVLQWQKLVQTSDAIIMLTPEYNNQLTAVQKNAIDWLYADWKDKPVAIASYGWSGGSASAELLVRLLNKVTATPLPTSTELFFMKDIAPDGSVIDEPGVTAKLSATIDELVDKA